MRRAPALAGVLLAAALVGALALAPTAASAEPTLVVTFDQPAYETTYGSGWLVSATVEYTEAGSTAFILDSTAGRVDFYVDGATTPYAAAVPLRDDGAAYLAQRTDQPYLVPGPHNVRAVFTPAQDTGVPTAEASTTLTVAPVALVAEARVVSASVDSATVALTASGSAIDAFDGMPAGVWTVSATTEGEDAVTASAMQAQGEFEEVLLELTGLSPGTSYDLAAAFEPHESVADGIDLTAPKTEQFSTASAGLAGFLQSTVPTEPWVVVAAGVLLAALVALVIVLAVRLRRRSTPAAGNGPREPLSGTAADIR